MHGFAVPINTAKVLMTRLLDVENKAVKRPWLGISGMALSPTLADALDLGTAQWVYVVTVTYDSPAQEAGLIEGGLEVDGIGKN